MVAEVESMRKAKLLEVFKEVLAIQLQYAKDSKLLLVTV